MKINVDTEEEKAVYNFLKRKYNSKMFDLWWAISGRKKYRQLINDNK